MADDEEPDGRSKRVAIVAGVLALVVLVAGAVVFLVSDGDDESATNTSSTEVRSSSTAPTEPDSTGAAGDPPCTNAAILAAVELSDPTTVSVQGFECGDGWAGTAYSNSEFDGAALLRAQGGTWVVVDRGQYCDDPSIPPAVHTFCTVS